MSVQTIMDTYIDGHEEDPALSVTVTFERSSLGPILKFNGPDGEVEIIGWGAFDQLMKYAADAGRFMRSDAAKLAEVA